MNDENNTTNQNSDIQTDITTTEETNKEDEKPYTKEFDISSNLDIKPATDITPEKQDTQKPFVSTLNVLNPVKKTEEKATPNDTIPANQKWGDLQSTISSMIPEKYKDNTKQEKPKTETSTEPVIQNPNLKPLRTYEGDIAKALANKRTSVATIAIAESKKKDGKESISDNINKGNNSGIGKKVFLLLISIIIIGSGIIGGYYLYTRSPLASISKTPLPTETPVIKSIIPSDKQVIIQIDSMNSDQIKQKIQLETNNSQTPNTIKEIILTKNKDGQKIKPSTQDMVEIMNITAPKILTKSLISDWMIGTYTDESGSSDVFAVAITDFFQDSFSGMLQWENLMPDDLKSYITSESIKNIVNGPPLPETTAVINKPVTKTITKSTNKKTTKKTETAVEDISTSTPTNESVTPYPTIRGQFVDRIIKSRDARVFKTSDGKTLFVYSFIDNKHLVFSGKESTMSAIISRLEKQAFVR